MARLSILLPAALLLLCSPPYTDLLPPAFVRHLWTPVPTVALPVLLAVLFLWLRGRTPENRPLVLARFALILPFVLTVATPILPDLLLDRRWAMANGTLFLLAPVALSMVSPSLAGTGPGKRLLFVAGLWLSSATGTLLVFLLVLRANTMPLLLTAALLSCLLATVSAILGVRPGTSLKCLTVFCTLLCAAALLQSVSAREAHGLMQEEETALKAGRITVGPYLQNLEKDGVTVMWETNTPAPGAVTISRRRGALSPFSPGECLTIRDGSSGTIHAVHLDSLLEDTQYYYQVVSNGTETGIGRFQTAHEGGQPFTFAVYGDSQKVFDWAEYLVRNRHRDVCESILDHSPEARFIVHVGDMTFLGNEHGRWAREFFDPARRLMRDTVVWPVIGNHELDSRWYFDYFCVPNENERYYSFDFGNSHFTVLAVEGYAVGHEYGPPTRTPMEPGSPQYAWLENDLASSRGKTWRFVFYHQPALSSGMEGEYTPARKILAPLFERCGVTAVFSGHDHDFECSIMNNVAHVVTGGGGGPINTIRLDARKNPHSRFFRGTWHHCRVHVDGNHFELEAVDLQGRVFYRLSGNKTADFVTLREE